MRVTFHATIREAAGTPEAEVRAASVWELLLKLRDMFGERLFSMLVEHDALREDVVILINGQNISHSGGLATKLAADDDVAIFPPVSGG